MKGIGAKSRGYAPGEASMPGISAYGLGRKRASEVGTGE